MRVLIAVGALALLAGCATNSVSPALLGMDNVEIGPGPHGYQYVNKVSYRLDGAAPSKADALPLCVARVVRNDSVTLSDNAGSFFGAYTGNYYKKSSAREAGGGNVIQYVSDDRSQVEAQGVLKYSLGSIIPIETAVRYGLSAALTPSARMFEFSGLSQAQMQTGAAANDGFNKVGAWPGANPDVIVDSLKRVAEDINNCLSEG